MYPKVYLKKSEFIQRKHPWIFSGALKQHLQYLHNQLVYVCDKNGEVVATGYYQDSSIAVKVLSFSEQIIDEQFWNQRILQAYTYRQKMNVFNSETNAYRLIFGEADEVPGLIVDNYNGHFVIQAHTEFIYQQKENICKAIKRIFQEKCLSFYDKSEYYQENGMTQNETIDTIIKENNLSFYVNWKDGQKTGFFLDQKDIDTKKIIEKYS